MTDQNVIEQDRYSAGNILERGDFDHLKACMFQNSAILVQFVFSRNLD